ncbi:LLM class flavin-dependent oxidoreductase [Corynebacterium pacaense]|uniref:LLM class flavin-dependent oxidoreductase n=1 Tax=Corynebacterium pacaense TaxID=1816684 RepID=UPI0009BB907C|nr:LLM class flavin-dependent oxidoreductase [Corynebacterium pacaense]
MSFSTQSVQGTRAPLGTSGIGEQLRIGFITHLDQHDNLDTIFADNIRLIRELERQGYDSAWIATRHFNAGWAALPSPFAFLGAAAAVTERIDLGTAVLPLVLDDPVRVAEEASVIDHYSGGRLLLGVGKGVPSDSFHVFEGWNSDRDRNFVDKVDRLHWALEGNRVEGGSASIWPPNTNLEGRIFHGSSNIETIRNAAIKGDGLILERFGNGPERTPENRRAFHQRQADSVIEYRRVFAETWGDTRTPYVITSRTAFDGPTTQEALEDFGARTARWLEQAELVGRADPAHTTEQKLLSDNAIWGDGAELAADLLSDPTIALSDELVLGIHPAAHTTDEAISHAAALLNDVVPLVRRGWAAQRAELNLSPVPQTIGEKS